MNQLFPSNVRAKAVETKISQLVYTNDSWKESVRTLREKSKQNRVNIFPSSLIDLSDYILRILYINPFNYLIHSYAIPRRAKMTSQSYWFNLEKLFKMYDSIKEAPFLCVCEQHANLRRSIVLSFRQNRVEMEVKHACGRSKCLQHCKGPENRAEKCFWWPQWSKQRYEKNDVEVGPC